MSLYIVTCTTFRPEAGVTPNDVAASLTLVVEAEEGAVDKAAEEVAKYLDDHRALAHRDMADILMSGIEKPSPEAKVYRETARWEGEIVCTPEGSIVRRLERLTFGSFTR